MTEADDYEIEDVYIYQKLIDKLMYLSYGTRPDIVFAVKLLNRHNANSRKGHMRAAKRVA